MAISSVSPTSAAWVDQLIQQTMAFERQPLTTLETQRDTLQVRSSIYNDITSKIETLQSSIENLIGDTYGLTNSFNTKSVSITNADPDVDAVSASLSSSSAAAGTYNLEVTHLAQAHQIRSDAQAGSNIALGLTGTFIIGGASARSVSMEVYQPDTVTDFDTATVDTDTQVELGTGTYYVEVRDNGGTKQFRLVDSNGDAVQVADVDDPTEATADWQTITAGTFDTGRGLTIEFGSNPTEGTKEDGQAAHVSYTAQAASIDVSGDDTLNDIRDAINAANFGEGNEVQATIVDNHLVLTAEKTGLASEISLNDSSNLVLESLGVLGATGAVVNELREAQDAQFTINNIPITRSTNVGLSDVVQGLSFNLKAEGSATVTVAKDDDTVVEDVKTLIDNVNDVLKYLKAKTEATVGDDDEDGNPTYTAALLGSDWNMRWLRTEIASDLLSEYTGAVGDAPSYLHELGITLDDDGLFTLSDETALTDALNDDAGAVQDLFSDLLGNLDDRLDRYVDGTDSLISYAQDNVDSEIEDLNDRIDSYEKRLEIREEALRTQYSAVQSMLISMTYEYQSFQAFSGSIYNQQY